MSWFTQISGWVLPYWMSGFYPDGGLVLTMMGWIVFFIDGLFSFALMNVYILSFIGGWVLIPWFDGVFSDG